MRLLKKYKRGKDNEFQPKQGNSVAWGIIAEAFKYGLDPTDEKQRRMAAAYLLEKVSWTGMSEFKTGLTASRTRQLCDAMTVSKDLMANLLLAAGGRGGISTGGGWFHQRTYQLGWHEEEYWLGNVKLNPTNQITGFTKMEDTY
ncbi:MAG: hypothetical protein IJ669_06920 [Prevotella sp.]|nr:hypothetical protein [Prevotella sp.]